MIKVCIEKLKSCNFFKSILYWVLQNSPVEMKGVQLHANTKKLSLRGPHWNLKKISTVP